MTLIAVTTNQNLPIVIGDILISSPEQRESIRVPSHSVDIDPYLDPNLLYRPSGYFQKIYVINKYLAAGLAGNVQELKSFLTELRQRCRYYEKFTFEIINSFLADFQLDQHFKESAFVIIWIEQDKEMMIHPMSISGPGEKWEYGISPVFGEVRTCGSGAQAFQSAINNVPEVKFPDSLSHFSKAVTQNNIFLASILSSERTSLLNLNQYWGAGFEMIFYGPEGFEKYENHAFLLLESQFDEEGNLSECIPVVVQYYKYHNNQLLISAIELKAPKLSMKNDLFCTESTENSENFFFVPALDSESMVDDEDRFKNLSFETDKLAIGYSVITNDESAIYPAFFYEGTEARIRYDHQNSIHVDLPTDIIQTIRQELIGRFENRGGTQS